MKRLFQTLLLLYPRSFRSEFSEEMLTTFEYLQREQLKRGSLFAILFFCREIAGLLRGISAEHMRLRLYSPSTNTGIAALNDSSTLSDVAELEKCIRFHLSQTINCIANHSFEGARFHAAEEDRARARLRMFEASRGG